MYDQHRAARERAAMSTHTPRVMHDRAQHAREHKHTDEPQCMFDRKQRLLDEVAQHIGEALLTYWGCAAGYIYKNDVIAMYPVLQQIGTVDRLSLFVKSGGGSGEA